jgi:hypothetical protein
MARASNKPTPMAAPAKAAEPLSVSSDLDKRLRRLGEAPQVAELREQLRRLGKAPQVIELREQLRRIGESEVGQRLRRPSTVQTDSAESPNEVESPKRSRS